MKKFFAAILAGCMLLSVGCAQTPKALDGKEGVFAVISTTSGDIIVELFYKDTPLTVTNFVGLAEGTLTAAQGKKYYDGLKFHRVISKANGDKQDFMIQGGDPKGNGTGGPGYKFVDEFVDGLSFDKPGYLAMANSGYRTNGSQFFITIVPTEWLTGKHTIFGKVVDESSQQIVNTLKQGTVMKSVKIYRLGEEAKKFTASQEDWNKRNVEATKKEALRKAKQVEAAFPGFAKDSNGIYYSIKKEGTGNKIGSNKTVTTEYVGYLITGEVFDGSEKMIKGGHEPLDFVTNGGQMIKGFDLMVQDMKLNEVRTIVIPSNLAYGDTGISQAGINGGDYIAFDVMVTNVK